MAPRILVIDDEPDMLRLIAYQLRSAGFRVFTATDGQRGLKRAQTLLPDLIILDVMLPDLEGFSVCEILRRLPSTAAIPVVMLTAMPGEMARMHGLNCGATAFMRKPFAAADLVGRVREDLAAHQKAQPDLTPSAAR